MKGIVSFIMSAVMALFPFFSAENSTDGYEKMTGLKQAVYSLFHMSEILNTEYEGQVSECTFSPEDEYRIEDTALLIKEKDKDFVILNITDTHIGDYDYRAFTAFGVFATLDRLVEEIKPDLITLTGDLVCTDSTYYSVRRLTDKMQSYGIPWAPVFGNHDGEGNCDLNYLADIMQKSPYCLLGKGDARMGCGNYVVNVAEKNDDGSLNIVQSLIFMDTHGSHVDSLQIEWYKWATQGVEKAAGKPVQTSAWMHIPMATYQYAFDAAWNPESKSWNEGYSAFGECNETICCQRDGEGNPIDNGLFSAMKQVGNTDFVFCGHEHRNNFSVCYDSIRLTYTMKIGKASGCQPGLDGGTVVTVNSGGISSIVQKTKALSSFKNLAVINTQEDI